MNSGFHLSSVGDMVFFKAHVQDVVDYWIEDDGI